MAEDRLVVWERFKREHPRGSPVVGTVRSVHPFGVFVDLGVPFSALLLVPYIRSRGGPLRYPEDYPEVGQSIEVMIRHYGDDIDSDGDGVGKIALTQIPTPLWGGSAC